jgi:WD40 repeat protein
VTASRDKTARIWNSESGAQIAVLRGHTEEVTSAIYSPDGKHVLTASRDGTAIIWDSASAILEAVLRGHEHSVAAAVPSPNSRLALTISDDNSARLWSIPLRCQPMIDAARENLPRGFTEQEKKTYSISDAPIDVVSRFFETVRYLLAPFIRNGPRTC